MYKWLLALLLIAPAAELWGILLVGDWLGGWTTFWIIIAIGAAGAYFAMLEGKRVWLEARRQLQMGQPPGRTLLDGICVLAGGLLLLIPGFFSDLIGLALLIPFTRYYFRQFMLKWIEKKMNNGHFTIRRF